MNRVGLKDYLLNHVDDNDLLDCAKAWDAANEYGYFETYGSVEEATASTDMHTSRPSATRVFSRMPATTSTISSIGLATPADMILKVSVRISS